MVTLNRPSLFHKTDWQEILSSHLKTVLAIALLLSIPTAARAEHKRGEKTFSFSGSLTSLVSQDGPTMGSGEVDFGLGYLLASRLQLLVEPSLTFDSSPTSSGHTDWTVDGGLTTSVRYYLRKDQKATVQPYLGTGLIVTSFNTPQGGSFSDNLATGVLPGVRFFFTPAASFDVNGKFGFKLNNPSAQQLWGLTFGFTISS